jgi:internalin A
MSELALQLIAENKKTRATRLDLGNCGLTELPLEVLECVWVEELILSSKWWDYDLEKNENSRQTSQNKGEANKITALPPNLINLTLLKKLVISRNQISDLSPIEHLTKLQILLCNSNQIADLSPIAHLTNLQQLDCSSNQISDLSPIATLTNLQTLWCESNQISDLSPISPLTNLQEFSCDSNHIADLSPIATLTNLQIFACQYNQISDLSPFSILTNLQEIWCSFNQISNLSPIATLANLQTLYCQSNQISDLSPITTVNNLQRLDFDSNEISDLSPIATLTNLQKLYCSDNQISDLSPISSLTNLQKLLCESNQISDLSPITFLTNLQEIDCNSNQIKKIFPLTQLASLYIFNVKGCPIEDCPSDIYQQGNIELLRQYFKSPLSLLTDTRKDVKLILLGNSAAGKTSLLHYLKTGHFLATRDSTHGLEVHRWLPNPDRFPDLADIAVSIWDFGGQEYYHDAYRLFMSDNAVYLLLWDSETNFNGRRSTCLRTGEPNEDLEHFERKYWLDTVRHYGGKDKDTPLLVIQNKTDLKQGKQRLAQNLHDEFDINESLHISLKEGCENPKSRDGLLLQHFELELSKILVDTADKVPLPKDWLDIRQSILDLQEGKTGSPFERYLAQDGSILRPDFNKACRELLGSNTSISLEGVINTFKRGGVVIYLPESDRLKKRIFLKPAQLAERIYSVLKKQVLDLGGEFDPVEVFKHDEDFKDVFIEVAQNLDLIFPHPRKAGWFIAPQYLPDSHPIEDLFKIAAHGAWDAAFWLRVPLFYYKKLLHHLILHYAADPSTEARHFWKHGIVFIKDRLRVVIKGLYPAEDEQEGVILIGVEPSQSGHRVLQKEIFEQCLSLFNQAQENLILKEILELEIKNSIFYLGPDTRSEEGFPNKGTDPKFLAQLEISKDNQYFVSYTALVDANNRDEIRVMATNKAGDSNTLLLREVEALLARPPRRAKKVFLSYSHNNTHWLGRLRTHLGGLRRSKEIEVWTDQETLPGEQWDKVILEKLKEADVFIMLLSADFISSEYIWNKELKNAFEDYKTKGKILIPVYTEPFDLHALPGIHEVIDKDGHVQSLKIQDFDIIPKDASGQLKAISLWANHDEAFMVVATQIRAALKGK